MPLTSGTRLGPYEILSALGAGGMGEVYRARDTKLDRDVAIKMLPEAFAADPERVARFQREAKTLASLNHPHIGAIHGLEEAGGVVALVLELVEGDTLAERIARGPIPIDDALAIAKQIAEALEAAHEQGIIHRDLKPANIKVTPDGIVKVLDFGLAKLAAPGAPGSGIGDPGSGTPPHLTNSPTLTSPAMMTGVGVILGTAAYMAPEQAKGRPADKRSDIWAFGCVLYEMLTGRRPFDGEDVGDVLAAVLMREPDWTRLPAETRTAIRVLLERSLDKDRRRRLGDIAAVLVLMQEAPRLASATSSSTVPVRRRSPLAIATAALIAAAVAGAGVAWWADRRPPPRVGRFTIAQAGTFALSISGAERDVAVTPDGSHVVYVGGNGGQLLVQALNELEPQPIATGAMRNVFVAPDGQWVGFVDNISFLKKVAITGGPAITLAQLDGTSRGATWIQDDAIVFATASQETGLQRVSAGGGEVTVLTRPDRARGELDHLWPEALPGSRGLLFTIIPGTGGQDAMEVAVLDSKTGARKVVIRGGSHAHYTSTGHLVYTASGTLRAVPFDLEALETRGASVPVLDQVASSTQGAGNYALAADGTLVYVDMPGAMSAVQRTMVWVDRQGREQPLGAPRRAYTYPRLSPDDSRVVVAISDEDEDLWTWDLARRTLTRLTFDAGVDGWPLWTPDGRQLIFNSQRGASVANLYRQPADGTGVPERLTRSDRLQQPTAITPDGKELIFHESTETRRDLMVLALDAPDQVRPLLNTAFEELNGVVSPDGRWLLYQSDASGRFEIYVRPFPEMNTGQWQVSSAGGLRPLWSRDGRELFYLSPEGTLQGVRVDSRSATWSAGTPVTILEARYFTGTLAGNVGRVYDVSRDGQRFLMIKLGGDDGVVAQPRIVVVQNWFEELKRLVPTN